MDGELSYYCRPLEVGGADIAKRGMPPDWVVETFDVVKHVGACRIPRRVPYAAQPGLRVLQ